MSENAVSTKEEKALVENIDFECPSFSSCFCEESQWITDLLKANQASCPGCESKLLIGTEDKDRLASVMKKRERFGKTMVVFMLLYTIGGLIVSLYFGGLGFILYMPVGLGIFGLLKALVDNQTDLTISLNQT
ncbi:hypothetical protein QT231_18420 [Halomonas sp. SpR1]|uniref:hypothetical protein n=1 Tax=Halomonas sp. SpR1 TaxID=3050462 RepID=UPI0027E41E1E|nr:hypothetical protein [Halomonas sp. SpR1]MDQ7734689.1 hypothetical protein [Halomonas sp. SpR1]